MESILWSVMSPVGTSSSLKQVTFRIVESSFEQHVFSLPLSWYTRMMSKHDISEEMGDAKIIRMKFRKIILFKFLFGDFLFDVFLSADFWFGIFSL